MEKRHRFKSRFNFYLDDTDYEAIRDIALADGFSSLAEWLRVQLKRVINNRQSKKG